jgi:ribA/ribD-fused uncharacterized protein
MADVTERDGFLFFWNGWPSQWYPAPFVIDGARYNCAEQFMMAEKARLFGDEGTLEEILAAPSPREQKALGRQVSGFEEARWKAVCREVVFRGNVAKFTQNEDLRALLLGSGDLVLAEASPTDRIWGIGLAAEHPRATQRAAWPGKNWLGNALMRVREELRSRPL